MTARAQAHRRQWHDHRVTRGSRMSRVGGARFPDRAAAVAVGEEELIRPLVR